MEKESVIKTSVAELAGKFTCQPSFPSGADGNKPARRTRPGRLQLAVSSSAEQGQDEQKGEVTSHPPSRNKNSAIIEKLQANLALSPTALLPSPMSPGAVKPHPTPFSPTSPCSPCTPTPSQEEVPASFETPAEGSVLQSINKGRARHSIKRRPPSRRQRKSSGDGAEDEDAVAPGPDGTASGASEEHAVEKQKIKAEPTDGAGTEPSTSQHHGDPNRSAAPESKQQPSGGAEGRPCEETSASAEEEARAEGETRCEEAQVASGDSVSTEPEGDGAAEGKECQEEMEQEEGGAQAHHTNGSEH